MTQPLTTSLEGSGVLTLTLDRPEKRNALSVDLRGLLAESFAVAADNPEVAAIVLTGAGGNFCAGGDISTMGKMTRAKARERMEAVGAAAMAVAACPKPLVAAVAGHVAGAGISLALLCDAVVASRNAKFTFGFLRVGLGPDWGLSHTLPRRVGVAAAHRLLLSQARVTSDTALALGLVDAVVDEADLAGAAIDHALRMSAAPSSAFASIKRQTTDLRGLEKALCEEADQQVERFLSREHLNAINSLSKR